MTDGKEPAKERSRAFAILRIFQAQEMASAKTLRCPWAHCHSRRARPVWPEKPARANVLELKIKLPFPKCPFLKPSYEEMSRGVSIFPRLVYLLINNSMNGNLSFSAEGRFKFSPCPLRTRLRQTSWD